MKSVLVNRSLLISMFVVASCATGEEVSESPLLDFSSDTETQELISDGPHYEDETKLILPIDYREWAFLGSGLGLTYDEEAQETDAIPPPPTFTNVFVNPSSYSGFLDTGIWPNESVFILEFRRSETDAPPNTGGRYQGDLLGIEAEVKDARFPDEWAFYNFGGGLDLMDVAPPLTGEAVTSCIECHSQKTAVERTFVQFYPTLLEVAREKGTIKAGF